MAVMINDPFLSRIYADVISELERSEKIHPGYTALTLRRAAITIEEGLEVVAEMVSHMLLMQQTALSVTRRMEEDSINDLRKELIQTAAMCFKHLRALDMEAKANTGDY